MLYNCTFYIGTGFNAINSPYDPSVLESSVTQADKVIVPQLELLQARELNSFDIAASYDDIKDADYLKLERTDHSETIYYAISPKGIKMTSPDVCTVNVDIDYLLTAGGCGELDVLDGITERHHVETNSDTYGAYTEEDPYMVPSKVLEIEGVEMFNSEGLGNKALISSTVDLYDMATETSATEYYATNGTQSCTVPNIISAHVDTTIVMPSPGGPVRPYLVPSATYFDPADSTIQTGIQKVRALGIESCITNQWCVPADFLTNIVRDTESGTTHSIGRILSVDGIITESPASSLLYEFANVNNKRVLYGDLCRYGLISFASGDKIEFNPEEIYHSGDSYPSIKVVTDPRPNGKPYFRFKYYNNDTANFWVNCIGGLEWSNVPLMYTDKSGLTVDSMRYNTEVQIRSNDTKHMVDNNFWSVAGSLAGNILRGSIGAVSKDYAGVAGSLMGILGNIGVLNDTDELMRDKMIEGNKEEQEFYLNTKIIAPDVHFPKSESIRDYKGNGIYVYRYRPSQSDVYKLDKILSMYGYRDTAPLTSTMFGVRSKFSYVRAMGVSVKLKSGNKLPRWIRDGIAQQLAVGTRIWKVKPDPTSYSDGSNT